MFNVYLKKKKKKKKKKKTMYIFFKSKMIFFFYISGMFFPLWEHWSSYNASIYKEMFLLDNFTDYSALGLWNAYYCCEFSSMLFFGVILQGRVAFWQVAY